MTATTIAATYETQNPLRDLLYTPVEIIENIGAYTKNIGSNLKNLAYGIYDSFKNAESHLEKFDQRRVAHNSAFRMCNSWNEEANGYATIREIPKEPKNLIPFPDQNYGALPNQNYNTIDAKFRDAA